MLILSLFSFVLVKQIVVEIVVDGVGSAFFLRVEIVGEEEEGRTED